MPGITHVSSNTGKVAVVATMWIVGLAMLVGFAALVQVRESAQVDVSRGSDADTSRAVEPLVALTEALAAVLTTAEEELDDGHRSRAVHGVTVAVALAEVGHATTAGPARGSYAVALDTIRETRRALWNGNPHRAEEHLARAADAVAEAASRLDDVTPSIPPREVWDQYAGAKLLDVHGTVMGEVLSLDAGRGGVMANLRLGRAIGVFGFLHLGGEVVEVAATDLLWGPRRSLGSVFVVMTRTPSPGTE